MKYVMFEEPTGMQYPIVFPDHMEHRFITQCVNAAYPGIKPISAGFVNAEGLTYGKSIGLNMNPLPGDIDLLKKLLGKGINE